MKTTNTNKLLFITLVILMFGSNYSQAQNLLNLNNWTIGQGTTGMFNDNGHPYENIREWGEGPGGKRVVLWKAQPEGHADDDGGWNTGLIPINHTNMYRFTVWMKKTNSVNGYSYFGCDSVTNLNGSANNNPYFWLGDLPELNKWYLLVGYVHGSGDVSNVSLGGIYDSATGAKVVDCIDFKFLPGTESTYHRSYLYYDPDVNDRQYFYAPRVDVVNGNEPSVENLLGLSTTGSALAYFPGQVGIQTHEPGSYELAVNGNVHAQQITIDLDQWPDYVFNRDYRLMSLDELNAFIKENNHLPEMPSEKEVAEKGLNLGDMNKLLTKKIEELTLYLIEKDKEIKEQRIKINNQDNRLQKIETTLNKK